MIHLVILVVILVLLALKRSPRQFSSIAGQHYSNEDQCHFVSSRGLAMICDVKPPRPVSSTKQLYLSKAQLGQIPKGATVYVPTSALGALANALSALRHPIVLVTGDADETVDATWPYTAIAAHPMVRTWYAQNLAMRHDKVHPLPIGLDYHTMSNNAPHISPLDQERVLLDIARDAAQTAQRDRKAYANFQFQTKVGAYIHDRRDALSKLPQSVMFYEPTKAPREACWRNMAKLAFCASPHGNGLDCHRTWEALCLKSVPIVKSSPLDPFYAQLPILIVQDWGEVTQARLDAFVETLAPDAFSIDMLRLSFWRSIFAKAKLLC